MDFIVMDIRLLGNVVLWLNGNMAALHKVVPCTSKRVYFVCFVNSFLYLRIYLSQYIRRCLHNNTEAPSEFLLKVCSGSLKTVMDWGICFLFLPLGTIFALTPRYLSTQVLKRLSLEWESSICQKEFAIEKTLFFLSTNSDC